jgi:hypothetical protein
MERGEEVVEVKDFSAEDPVPLSRGDSGRGVS